MKDVSKREGMVLIVNISSMFRCRRTKWELVLYIPKPKFQLNFSELQRQSDGKENIVGAQTTHASMPMQQQSQKELLICDDIKVDEVGYYAGNRETFVFNYVNRMDEAVPGKSSTRNDTNLTLL